MTRWALECKTLEFAASMSPLSVSARHFLASSQVLLLPVLPALQAHLDVLPSGGKCVHPDFVCTL